MKCYWMLQNAMVTMFTMSISELLKENQQGEVNFKIRVKIPFTFWDMWSEKFVYKHSETVKYVN